MNAVLAIYLVYFVSVTFLATVAFSIVSTRVDYYNRKFARGFLDESQNLFQRFISMGLFFHLVRWFILLSALFTTVTEAGEYWYRVDRPWIILASIWIASIALFLALTGFLNAITACRHCLQREEHSVNEHAGIQSPDDPQGVENENAPE